MSFVEFDRVEEFTTRMSLACNEGYRRYLSVYNVKLVRGAEAIAE